MDKELFELCKRVYEATGWENDPYKKHINKAEKYEHRYGESAIYTSDYLLEKLPRSYDGYPVTVGSIGENDWQAWYYNEDGNIQQIADTPLKALLKLTLALKEAGEL